MKTKKDVKKIIWILLFFVVSGTIALSDETPGPTVSPTIGPTETPAPTVPPGGGNNNVNPAYIIITTSTIESGAFTELCNFVAEKERLGFVTEVITEEEWGGGFGDAAADNLRAWLQAHYQEKNMKYVLLIGNPHKDYGDVPMKWCTPVHRQDSDGNWTIREIDSDFYYADLDGDWDGNADGLVGRYPDDFEGDGVDTDYEVIVGRIPYYGLVSELNQILARLANYTQTNNFDYRKTVLLPSAPLSTSYLGYQFGEAIKEGILSPMGYIKGEYVRIYANATGNPEVYPLSSDTVLSNWLTSRPGVVIWSAHGDPYGASYTMNSSLAGSLSGDYPVFTFQSSCSTGRPTVSNNLAYSILLNGGINTVASTRMSNYGEKQYLADFQGGISLGNGVAYEYARRLIGGGMTAGNAYFNFCKRLPPTSDIVWRNQLEFVMYGDPSLQLDPPYVQVDGGFYHTLALTSNGSVWAWGHSGYGQVGNGTNYNNYTPQLIDLEDIKEVSAGGYFSVALKRDGTVAAWGINDHGQLGTGTYTNEFEPVELNTISDVRTLAAGRYHTLAVKNDGTVWGWGNNNNGQLADGSIPDSSLPMQIYGLQNITSVEAGRFFSLALEDNGNLWAWGSNANGVCGTGTIGGTITTPTQVQGLPPIKTVTAGDYHVLAIDNEDRIWAWGYNWYGQLGIGNNTDQASPVLLPTAKISSQVRAGIDHSIFLTMDGEVYAMGRNNYGQLGVCTITDTNLPVLVTGLTDILKIGSGYNFNICINSDFNLVTWAQNNSGQLGDATSILKHNPQKPGLMPEKKHVAAGGSQSFCLNYKADLLACGNNSFYQLGTDLTGYVLDMEEVQINTEIVDIDTGYTHTIAVGSTNAVYAWGQNVYGQLGIPGGAISIPTAVPGLSDIIAVAAGYYHSLALKSNGTVWAWGNNMDGQLGTGDSSNTDTPVQCSGLSNIIKIGAGMYFSAALDGAGKVYTWGANNFGNLGHGDYTVRYTPEKITGLSSIVDISVGDKHVFALDRSGDLWVWGSNGSGELGIGNTPAHVLSPVMNMNIEKVKKIAGGSGHSLAITEDGHVWAWGSNSYGQVGDGTTTTQYLPVEILNNRAFIDIAAGQHHSIVYRCDDKLYTWGYNGAGQLGTGDTVNLDTPERVTLPNPKLNSVTPDWDHEIIYSLDDLNYGVACRDSATGTGFIMYSEESVHTRFTAGPPHSSNADHFIGVVFSDGWKYDNNSTLIPFTPRDTDILVASVDFSADTAEDLFLTRSIVAGIECGYAWGDIRVIPDKWNNSTNNGEFMVKGETLVPHRKTGNLRAGIAAQDDAGGMGFIMYTVEPVSTRFAAKPPHAQNSDHFIYVTKMGSIWYYDTNTEYVPFEPRESDILICSVFPSLDKVTMYEGIGDSSVGIQTGYITGDINVICNRFNGSTNEGEFEVIGTYFTPNINVKKTHYGIAAIDDATGIGYIMYSAERLSSRFSSNPPASKNGDHLITVKYFDGAWHYDNNSDYFTFTPRDSDILIAEVDFTANTVDVLEGVNDIYESIQRGINHCKMIFHPEKYLLDINEGEFAYSGFLFTPWLQ